MNTKEKLNDNKNNININMETLLKDFEDFKKKFAQLEHALVLDDKISTNYHKQKIESIHNLKYSITELIDRMKTPYLMGPELKEIIETLDILAMKGIKNSIILEGEPGTGKTQLGYSLAGQDIMDGKDVSLIHIRIKPGMRPQDALYTVDDVRRLSDAQTKVNIPNTIKKESEYWKDKLINDTISGNDIAAYEKFKKKFNDIVSILSSVKDLAYENYIEYGQLGEAIFQSSNGTKVYLIIDEIEKGDESFMVGLLDEIEHLEFQINETGHNIKGDKKNMRIIVTTNTEESNKIPGSFRRRCLYHNLLYPTKEEMAEIVKLHYKNINEDILEYALDVFYKYHNHPDITKKPSTPELLEWIEVLIKKYKYWEIPGNIPYKGILLKYRDDLDLDPFNYPTREYPTREYSIGEYSSRERGDDDDT